MFDSYKDTLLHSLNKYVDLQTESELLSSIFKLKKINTKLYTNLEIIEPVEQSVFYKLNKTTTPLGKYYLKQELTHFKYKIEELNAYRTDLDVYFKHIDENKDYLINLFNSIKKNIETCIKLYSYSSKKNIFSEIIDDVFFSDYFSNLNNYPSILTGYTLLNVYSPIYNVTYPVLVMLIPVIFAPLFNHIPFINRLFKLMIPRINLFSIRTTMELSKVIFSILLYAFNVYNSIKTRVKTELVLNYMGKSLLQLKDMFEITKKIGLTLNITVNDSPLINAILKFDSTESSGSKMILFKHIINSKNDIAHYFKILGKVDYLLCLYKLYKRNDFSIVHFENYSKPLIFMRSFKHPFFLDDKTHVKNTLCTNICNTSQNAFITGPNAGGKSTLIKAIMTNVLLAQTLGIALCEAMFITPFYFLESHMNNTDSKGSVSLFENEIKSIRQFIDIASKTNRFCFIIIDELCSGTNSYESEIAAQRLTKHLASHANVVSIITTHIRNITMDTFDFYKMKIKNKNKYTFKLVPGSSTDYLGLTILDNYKFS
jgi:DNA mismatch repair ATPase MutS